MTDDSTIKVMLTRESINAGDDFDAPHGHLVEVPRSSTFTAVFENLWAVGYCPDTSPEGESSDIWALAVSPRLGEHILIAALHAGRTDAGADISWAIDSNTPLSDPRFATERGYISAHMKGVHGRDLGTALDYARKVRW
ncbi:hypothetical protein AB0H76_05030 [Nocardia sp. NPDC050712]|uniref:hypothetical protein n=1 Tax=Nocardia sp. NPDC050712 TaxID=3155518 RepID=UPI0033C622D6